MISIKPIDSQIVAPYQSTALEELERKIECCICNKIMKDPVVICSGDNNTHFADRHCIDLWAKDHSTCPECVGELLPAFKPSRLVSELTEIFLRLKQELESPAVMNEPHPPAYEPTSYDIILDSNMEPSLISEKKKAPDGETNQNVMTIKKIRLIVKRGPHGLILKESFLNDASVELCSEKVCSALADILEKTTARLAGAESFEYNKYLSVRDFSFNITSRQDSSIHDAQFVSRKLVINVCLKPETVGPLLNSINTLTQESE